MSASATSVRRPATETSPELVLVDEALARHARENLPAPDDTLARLEHDIWVRRVTALERATAEAALTEHRDEPAQRRPAGLLTRRRQLALLAATAAAGTTLALLLGVNVNLRGAPAGADSFETATAPESVPESSPVAPRANAPSTPKPRSAPRTPRTGRTFAWAPVPDASGYHVELFRGERRVFAVDVSAPRFTLPPSWNHAGRTERLDPATYRWNVWPVVAGLRQSQAIVQTELVVP